MPDASWRKTEEDEASTSSIPPTPTSHPDDSTKGPNPCRLRQDGQTKTLSQTDIRGAISGWDGLGRITEWVRYREQQQQ